MEKLKPTKEKQNKNQEEDKEQEEITIKETKEMRKITMEDLPQNHYIPDETAESLDDCPYIKRFYKWAKEHEDDEEDLQLVTSGCPCIQPGSMKKRNPGLEFMIPGFELPYKSQYQHRLSLQSLLTGVTDKKTQMKYPYFLQHTLFHADDDKVWRIRKEFGAQLTFSAADDFREAGNKEFLKDDYKLALEYYEYAMGCFYYLEYNPIQKRLETFDDPLTKEQRKQIQQELMEGKLDKKYVYLYDGQDLTGENAEWDQSTRKNFLYQVFMNMAVCYLTLNHYWEAKQVLQCAKRNGKNSITWFRFSQTMAQNLDSTYEELNTAETLLKFAIKYKKDELIWTEATPKFLFFLNIHNADQAFKSHLQFILRRQKERRKWELDRIEPLFENIKQMELLDAKWKKDREKEEVKQQEVIVNQSRKKTIEESMEVELVDEMAEKYLEILQFFEETNNINQIKPALQEMHKVKETQSEIKFYVRLTKQPMLELVQQARKKSNLQISIEEQNEWIAALVKEKITEAFEASKFNLDVYKMAMNSLQRKKQKQRDKKEKKDDFQFPVKGKNTLTDLDFIWQFVVIVLFGVFIYYVDQQFGYMGTAVTMLGPK